MKSDLVAISCELVGLLSIAKDLSEEISNEGGSTCLTFAIEQIREGLEKVDKDVQQLILRLEENPTLDLVEAEIIKLLKYGYGRQEIANETTMSCSKVRERIANLKNIHGVKTDKELTEILSDV